MKCPRCGYEWETKIPRPKECPRCKARLDYEPGPVGAPKIRKKGGVKEMTSRLPWATAAILIVAAVAVGTWALYGVPVEEEKPEEQPPTEQPGTITVVGSNLVFAGGTPPESGIENIVIMRHIVSGEEDGYDNTENLTGDAVHENVLASSGENGVLEQSTDSTGVPYDNYFDIVVQFKIHTNQVSDITQLDNFQISIDASGSYTMDNENSSSTSMFSIENSADAGATWGRYNAVFNNGGAGYTLSAGASLVLDNVRLWGWV